MIERSKQGILAYTLEQIETLKHQINSFQKDVDFYVQDFERRRLDPNSETVVYNSRYFKKCYS